MRAGRFASLIRGDEAHLCLLATTDLHMHLLPYDYAADRPADRPCLAQVAQAVARVRAEVPNVLLLDNGDFLQGSPMGDFFALDRGLGPDEVHPMIAAMNALGFDAGTLGNHEFNYGLDFLLRVLRDARFPVVSANLLARAGSTPAGDVPLVAPHALLRRELRTGDGSRYPITIGILGLAPPQTVQWEGAALVGRAEARDMVDAARHHVPILRADGADLVIALAHTGIGTDCPTAPGQENAARALARVPGIDALVLGHQHLVFPSRAFDGLDTVDGRAGTIGGKPAVMSGHYGRHLGVIDLRLAPQPGGGWALPEARARVLDLGRRPATAGPARSAGALGPGAARAHAETLDHIRQPIGRVAAPLHTFFVHLGATRALGLIAAAQRAWFAEQPAAAGVAHLPVISVAAPVRAGGRGGPAHYADIPAGALTHNDAHTLYPYPNKLAAVVMTGAELATWLEAVARHFNPVAPGARDVPLLPEDAPAYNFDMFDGLDYTFDLSASGRRLQALRHAGCPVTASDRFVVLTSAYRASGGGGLVPPLPRGRHMRHGPGYNRSALVHHLARGADPAEGAMRGGWRVTAAAGTSAVLDTSPRAAQFLHEIAIYRPEPLGETAEGFLRLRLNF